jgi:hypothetical protein
MSRGIRRSKLDHEMSAVIFAIAAFGIGMVLVWYGGEVFQVMLACASLCI